MSLRPNAFEMSKKSTDLGQSTSQRPSMLSAVFASGLFAMRVFRRLTLPRLRPFWLGQRKVPGAFNPYGSEGPVTVQHTVRSLMPHHATDQCQVFVWLDVHGVLDKLSMSDCVAVSGIIRYEGPQVVFGILSYQTEDRHWPKSARPNCTWKQIVDVCRVALFPKDRPEPSDIRVTDCEVFKRPEMPAKFWGVCGSKTSVLASMTTPCILIDDHAHPAPRPHRCIVVRHGEIRRRSGLVRLISQVVNDAQMRVQLPLPDTATIEGGPATSSQNSSSESRPIDPPKEIRPLDPPREIRPRRDPPRENQPQQAVAECTVTPCWDTYRNASGRIWLCNPANCNEWFFADQPSASVAAPGWERFVSPTDRRIWFYHAASRLCMWPSSRLWLEGPSSRVESWL